MCFTRPHSTAMNQLRGSRKNPDSMFSATQPRVPGVKGLLRRLVCLAQPDSVIFTVQKGTSGTIGCGLASEAGNRYRNKLFLPPTVCADFRLQELPACIIHVSTTPAFQEAVGNRLHLFHLRGGLFGAVRSAKACGCPPSARSAILKDNDYPVTRC